MTRINELQRRLQLERTACEGRRWRCSKALRRDVTVAGQDLLAQGWTISQLASTLRLRTATIERWLSKAGGDRRANGFRQVELTTERASELCLVTPSGFRVEGLNLEQVKQLLRDVQ
jgi:hypothetical protein